MCRMTPNVAPVSRPVSPSIGRPLAPPIPVPMPPVTQGAPWLPGCVVQGLKAVGGLCLSIIGLMLLFNGYWPILVWLFFLTRVPKVRQVVWPLVTACARALVTGGPQLGRGLVVSYHWLLPRLRQLGRAVVVIWSRSPTLVKELVPIALLIMVLAAISYFGDNANPVRQPPSPLATAQPVLLRESPLATPTVNVR